MSFKIGESMTRKATIAMTTTCLLIIAPVLAQQAANQSHDPTEDQSQALMRFEGRHGKSWTVRWSKDHGLVQALRYHGKQLDQLPRDDSADAFLRRNVGLFRLQQELSDLQVLTERRSLGGRHVEYQQIYGGLPVENARVKVNLDSSGRVLEVVNGYRPDLEVELEPAVSREKAVEQAIEAFLAATSRAHAGRSREGPQPVTRQQLELSGEPQVERVIFVSEDRAVVAYKVLLDTAKPFARTEVVIDGQSGEVLRLHDLIQSAVAGEGRVFIPNPVCALNDPSLRDDIDASTGLPAGDDAAAAVPNAAYTDVVLPYLNDPLIGHYWLCGPYVCSKNIQSPATSLATETTPNFSYTRDQDGFEEVMVYYHIDRSQRYIQTLGFIDVNNRQVWADAHGYAGNDAFYYPNPVGSGYLAFGDGSFNYGEDGDIILHEYGHSIQDNQTGGAYLGNTGHYGAMGEGFGDYWASSHFFDAAVASGWIPGCYAEWQQVILSEESEDDEDDENSCRRRVDSTRRYPGHCWPSGSDCRSDGVHLNGWIWSGALWDIFNALGKTTADRLVLQSHFNVPYNPSFEEGADAIMAADLQLFYGTHSEDLCQIFMDRGIFESDDCADIPSPTSLHQDTLVVQVNLMDESFADSPSLDVAALLEGLNEYLAEVTYSQTQLSFQVEGWLTVPGRRADYYDPALANPLVELVADTLAALADGQPGLDLTQYERLLVITNDDGSSGVAGDWATTGPWRYELPDGTEKLLSASVHRYVDEEAQFTHALGHHFGLIDLYEYPGADFPRPYADGWGNMARTLDDDGYPNVHYLGWSKLRAGWLDDGDVTFIPRPDPGTVHDEDYPLYYLSSDANGHELIQIGVTNGVRDRTHERVSYYVEARNPVGYDSNLPITEPGVLIYRVNEDISQGYGPVKVIDAHPSDGNGLANASLHHVGDRIDNVDGINQLSIELVQTTDTEDFRVQVVYDPPEDDVNVWIEPHDRNWRSPDIWVDHDGLNSLGVEGYDLSDSPSDRGDQPMAGATNRLYARVHNDGPGVAHDVVVDFWVSDPYHAIDGGGQDPETGGNTAFNKHFQKVIENLPVTGDNGHPEWKKWVPEPPPSGSVHSCVKVKIASVDFDTNPGDQVAQENFHSYDTTADSPYDPVQQPFRVVNPYDRPILVYLRAENVPVGWRTEILPEKVHLPIGGSVDATVTIYPPDVSDYPVCSTERITTKAWYPSGDTLVELGGTTAEVNLKKSTELMVETDLTPCPPLVTGGDVPVTQPDCRRLSSQGCTHPPRPYELVYVSYTGPDGEPVYHEAMTDEHGCFEDFFENPSGGVWEAKATYPGDHCNAAAEDSDQPVLVLPQPHVPPALPRGLWYSLHLGMGFPTGAAFDEVQDPGPSIAFDVERFLRCLNKDQTICFALRGVLGFHDFDGDAPNFYASHASLNLRLYRSVSSWQWFVELGAGAYLPKSGGGNFGVQVASGWILPLDSGGSSERLALELGVAEHVVMGGDSNWQFLDVTSGIRFRF